MQQKIEKQFMENNNEIKQQNINLIQDSNKYLFFNNEQKETNPLIYNYYFGKYSEKFTNSSKNSFFFNDFFYNSQQHYPFSPNQFNYQQNSCCRFFIIKSSNEENIHKVKFDLISFSQLNIEYGVVQ